MCTILFLFQVVRNFPVVISENRDASLAKYVRFARINYQALADRPPKLFYPPINPDREACDPLETVSVPFIGPFDVSNVTWIGVNQHGVVLALTNGYKPYAEQVSVTRSRGLLANEVLQNAVSAQAAQDRILRALETNEYKSANFLVADSAHAWVIHYWGEEAAVQLLDPGIHVFGNYYFPGPARLTEIDKKVEWLVDDTRIRVERGEELVATIPQFQRRPISKADALTGIRAFITDHGGDPQRGINICRHAVNSRDVNYRRTLSNTTIFLNADNLEESAIYYSAGTPCTEKWQDRSFLFEPDNFSCQFLAGEGQGDKEGGFIPRFGKFPLDH